MFRCFKRQTVFCKGWWESYEVTELVYSDLNELQFPDELCPN